MSVENAGATILCGIKSWWPMGNMYIDVLPLLYTEKFH
jgi:hypothetical protein